MPNGNIEGSSGSLSDLFGEIPISRESILHDIEMLKDPSRELSAKKKSEQDFVLVQALSEYGTGPENRGVMRRLLSLQPSSLVKKERFQRALSDTNIRFTPQERNKVESAITKCDHTLEQEMMQTYQFLQKYLPLFQLCTHASRLELQKSRERIQDKSWTSEALIAKTRDCVCQIETESEVLKYCLNMLRLQKNSIPSQELKERLNKTDVR